MGGEDPWSDWRLESESSRERTPSGSFNPVATATSRPQALFYSDGTELLSEVHHHADIPAQTYHLEEVLPTPKARHNQQAPSFSTPPGNRSSARLSGTLGSPAATTVSTATKTAPATTGTITTTCLQKFFR